MTYIPESDEVIKEINRRLEGGEELIEVRRPLTEISQGLEWHGTLREAWALQHAIDRWCWQEGVCLRSPMAAEWDTAIRDGCRAHLILDSQRRLDYWLEEIRQGSLLPHALIKDLGVNPS
jgi:hypothetical protein